MIVRPRGGREAESVSSRPSGAACEYSGLYRSACPCGVERSVPKGRAFPDCPACGPVDWELLPTSRLLRQEGDEPPAG